MRMSRRDSILSSVTWISNNVVGVTVLNRVQNRAYILSCSVSSGPCKQVGPFVVVFFPFFFESSRCLSVECDSLWSIFHANDPIVLCPRADSVFGEQKRLAQFVYAAFVLGQWPAHAVRAFLGSRKSTRRLSTYYCARYTDKPDSRGHPRTIRGHRCCIVGRRE